MRARRKSGGLAGITTGAFRLENVWQVGFFISRRSLLLQILLELHYDGSLPNNLYIV